MSCDKDGEFWEFFSFPAFIGFFSEFSCCRDHIVQTDFRLVLPERAAPWAP